VANGNQAALHGGFPHGDADGYYVLFDSDTGRALEKFISKEGSTPDWVKLLQSREKEH
jgi:hypothetical protein